MRTVAEITLGREPDAVPRARRLVRSALVEERPALAGDAGHVEDHGEGLFDLIADAELVVSELVTNAALHGEPPITVRVLVNRVVRLEVEDAGRSAPILLRRVTDAMTGRGLSMVAAVATSWGIEPIDADDKSRGKVVWAELDPDRSSGSGRTAQEIDVDALLEAWADDNPSTATYTVRLGPVSTKLLLEAKAHIDSVVRELMLMREGEASSGVALPPELSAVIQTVTVEFAEARTEIKRQAAAAASRGDILTDLELHLSPSAADAGERYLEALDEADRYGRAAHFLTLAPPRIHRIFRRWYVRALVRQLRSLARGEEAPPHTPFQLVLVEEVTKMGEAAESAGRLAMLQTVSGELARAVSADQMARLVVDRSVELLGVESARIRLVTPDGFLRSAAWRVRLGPPDSAPDDPGPDDPTPADPTPADNAPPDIPLDSDLPCAVVARTRRPLLARSLSQAFADVPEMAEQYEPGTSGHIVPLAVGTQTFGVLTLAFKGGELSDEAEQAFVQSLAEVVGQALERAERDQAASLAVEAGRELERAHENLRFVLEATTQVAASLDSDDTLRTLARIAVPALADLSLIDLWDGHSFRRAATAASETVAPDVAAELARFAPDSAGGHPARTAVSTGRPVFIESMDDELFRAAAADDEHLRFIRQVGAHSCIALPLAARGRTLGAITLLLVRPGRRYSESDISMIEDLASRVAFAVDTTQLYENAREAERRLALVARAGVSLTSSLDLDTVVARLCELVTGQVADRCEVYVRRSPGQWWRHGPDSAFNRLVRVDHLPEQVAQVVESRTPAASRSAGDTAVITSVIPLLAHGDVVGVISLGSSGPDSPIRVPADTVAVIAGRAALAIDNALLYEQERTAAEILQRSLLPSHLPDAPGLRAAARYLPAGARNEVGGDWYDLFPLGPGRMGVVMGDVMGRGIPAASIMGQLRNGLRMLAFQDMDPAAALQLLNRMLGAGEDSPLATVAYGVIDVPGRTLTLANAGHMPTLLLRGPDSRYLDGRIGLPLGALPDATYTTTVDRLEPGDAVILYTDGLIEQRDRGLDEGLGALLAVARSAGLTHPADPDTICDLLLESFRRDSDEDDTAALVLLLDPLEL